MPITKPDFNLIFASQAPSQDLPAAFNNYARGWDEARKNNGKPTIKQFNYLIQQLDLKALWMIQNGAALPFDETVDYAEGAFTVKDGSLQQLVSGVWRKPTQTADQIFDESGLSQQQVNYNGGSKWHSRVGGYKLNERVVLTKGDIVKSTVDGNTNDPNVDMTGWEFPLLEKFKTVGEMAAYPNVYEGMSAYVEDMLTGGWFVYKQNKSSINNGITIYNGFCRVYSGAIDACWSGITPDYNPTTKTGADASEGITRAILAASSGATDTDLQNSTVKPNEESRRVFFSVGGAYFLENPLLIPSGIELDCNNAVFGGKGYDINGGTAFETGYYVNGELVSNLTAGAEVGRVIYSRVVNFRLVNLYRGWNFKNFNEGSYIGGGAAYNVNKVGEAIRCFYGEFDNVTSRGNSGGSLEFCYTFDSFVNIQSLNRLVATNRTNMMSIGNVNGCEISHSSFEDGSNGLTLKSDNYPLHVRTNYFEHLTGNALDLGSSIKRHFTANNNWFFNITGDAIKGSTVYGGKIAYNEFQNVTGYHVNINDVSSTVTVDILPRRYNSSPMDLRPTSNEKYNLGRSVDVHYRNIIFNNSTGVAQVSQNYVGENGIVDLPYSGDCGYINQRVPFCAVSFTNPSGGYDIVIDTKIRFNEYVLYAFKFTTVDNNGSYNIYGTGFGTNLHVIPTTNIKPIIASNNEGYLRLTISGLNHPTVAQPVTGVVRMM